LLKITPDAERLIEAAGRTCYDTGDRAAADSAAKFIRMLIRRGHLSVLEHASATFRVKGVSRALTHQLVRHRLASYSQRSQRYVKEDGLAYVTPPAITANKDALEVFRKALEEAREAYDKLLEAGVAPEDARFVLPNAAATEVVVTANFREWRHVLALRGHAAAQWEIRRLAIARINKQ
jgi:thymidylate synthase (FAD)